MHHPAAADSPLGKTSDYVATYTPSLLFPIPRTAKWAELGLTGLLLTRSEEGMTLFDAQGRIHVSAQAREVFDVTGAGDTVIATLAALVAAGWSLRQALPVSNRAGGLVVGKFGTASVSYEELFA